MKLLIPYCYEFTIKYGIYSYFCCRILAYSFILEHTVIILFLYPCIFKLHFLKTGVL